VIVQAIPHVRKTYEALLLKGVNLINFLETRCIVTALSPTFL
jgi:hypothetical protein